MAAIVTVEPQRGQKKFVKVMQAARCNVESSPHFQHNESSDKKNFSPRTPVAYVSMDLRQLQRHPKKFVKVLSEKYSNHSSPHFQRRKPDQRYVNEKATAESVARAHERLSDPDRSIMVRRRLRVEANIPKVGDSTADESDCNQEPATNAATIVSGKEEESKVRAKAHKKSFCRTKMQANKGKDSDIRDQESKVRAKAHKKPFCRTKIQVNKGKDGDIRDRAERASSGSTEFSKDLALTQTSKKAFSSSDGSKLKASTLRSSSKSYVSDNKCTNKKCSRRHQDNSKTKKGGNLLEPEIDDSSHKKNQMRSRGGKQELPALQPARRGRSLSPKKVVKIPQKDDNMTRKQKRSKSMPPRQDRSYRLRRSSRPAPLPRARLFTHRSTFNGSSRAAKEVAYGFMKLFGTSNVLLPSRDRTETDSMAETRRSLTTGRGGENAPREIATNCTIDDPTDSIARYDGKKRLQERGDSSYTRFGNANDEGNVAGKTRRTRCYLAKSRPRRKRIGSEFHVFPRPGADEARRSWVPRRDAAKMAAVSKFGGGVCMQACSLASTSCSSGESYISGKSSITEMCNALNKGARNSDAIGQRKPIVIKHVHISC